MATICIFGDSIGWGSWDPTGGGWIERLDKYLKSKTDDYWIYNLSIGGDTTEDLLKRFECEMKARSKRSPIDFIIFTVGINDSARPLTESASRVSLEKFEQNLSLLLSRAQNFTKMIVFIGLTRVEEAKTIPWEEEYYFENERIGRYNKVLKDFCTQNKIHFIEMLDLLTSEDLDDGLHPNSRGHQKMFERIKKFLIDKKLINTLY